ncbi:bifunctional 4-hydroxy-2-oxoglutarate aldolase/2-dehydro-3-deoxy-phosphogluconate aldolase [Pleomorphomonas koreensis]|uniref:bifunctional 4-hydroxy-2-oxoglutarate aldolase/2-dehydro-3-deoxy-phosphogluconate aldolase n=1 Tax=Pleomorphomonas koreensis TaxID=257440 RepID=UPI00040D8F9B|nr:bifunctional 4-hydroxy-2-oxoglutarate aldolase/2-dehydro-3-deoxy-phosphogluconate aldolase [Pleomorphomonas koreensis]
MFDTAPLLDVLNRAPVVPVLVIDKLEDAFPLGAALVNGGLPALEVTMRTSAALNAIHAMCAIPGSIVGAGTVLDGAQAKKAVEAGAKFLVSPGSTPDLIDAAKALGVPILPGVATASEAMMARERGLKILKFFPAEQAGGPSYLKALASPLQDIRFCPTGGVSLDTAPDYLALPNVICVGGSWVAPADAVKSKNWIHIENLARHAASLRS